MHRRAFFYHVTLRRAVQRADDDDWSDRAVVDGVRCAVVEIEPEPKLEKKKRDTQIENVEEKESNRKKKQFINLANMHSDSLPPLSDVMRAWSLIFLIIKLKCGEYGEVSMKLKAVCECVKSLASMLHKI